LIDGLRCYGDMYLYRLRGGRLHDRFNLVLICYNHILYIRNSNKPKPNLLHDRSNLVLICYNYILFIRNSNKLESRIGNNDTRSGKWNNKKIGGKKSYGLCSLSLLFAIFSIFYF
jgi:hypothetical protein